MKGDEQIDIETGVTESDLKSKIEAQLRRNALMERNSIKIEIVDNTVILNGTVNSMREKEDAKSVAWKVPGGDTVENRLTVQFREYVH